MDEESGSGLAESSALGPSQDYNQVVAWDWGLIWKLNFQTHWAVDRTQFILGCWLAYSLSHGPFQHGHFISMQATKAKEKVCLQDRSYSPLLSNHESDTASPLSCSISHSKFQVILTPRGEDYTRQEHQEASRSLHIPHLAWQKVIFPQALLIGHLFSFQQKLFPLPVQWLAFPLYYTYALKNIHLFMRLCQVLVTAHDIFIVSFRTFLCGTQTLVTILGLSSCCTWALWCGMWT